MFPHTTGMFNTGTNPFGMYIEANCKMPYNKHDSHGGTRWQVPWGKVSKPDSFLVGCLLSVAHMV